MRLAEIIQMVSEAELEREALQRKLSAALREEARLRARVDELEMQAFEDAVKEIEK